MRIALLADIHGNVNALDTALTSLKGESVDETIFLGDAFSTGPWPHETLQRMKDSISSCIIGNHDKPDFKRPNRAFLDEDIIVLDEIDEWCLKQLTSADIDYLNSFKPILEVPLDNGMIMLAFHGSPRSNNEWIFSNTPESKLEETLSGYKGKVMVCGHTHVQMLRQYCDTLLINPGSVGLPFQAKSSSESGVVAPRVEYAILEYTDSGLKVDFRKIAVDIETRKKDFSSSRMPHSDIFFEVWPRRISNLYAKLASRV